MRRTSLILNIVLLFSTTFASKPNIATAVRDRYVLTLEEWCGGACRTSVRQSALRYDCVHTSSYPELRVEIVRCPRARTGYWARSLATIHGVRDATIDSLISAVDTRSDDDVTEIERNTGTLELDKSSVREELEASHVSNWGWKRMRGGASQLNYACYPHAGRGARIFVVDTGCYLRHEEFQQLPVKETIAAPGSDFDDGQDNNGHGTHVAAVIVGANVGLARGARLTCIKSFDENGVGSSMDMISAVEYIVQRKLSEPQVPYIVNLSYSALTGFSSTVLDELVYRSSAKGIVFVVAAGNAGANSCLFSPSKAKQAFTVTASTQWDTREKDANTGACVEFIAPGHDILSAGILSRRNYQKMNGTSMAAPHVAAVSTLVLAEELHLQQIKEGVRDALYGILTSGKSDRVAGYVMPLLNLDCVRKDDVNTLEDFGESVIMNELRGGYPLSSEEPEGSDEPMSSSAEPSLSWDYWLHRRALEMFQDLGYVRGDHARFL